MKIHTTNYINTFTEIAEDCPVNVGTVPFSKENKPTIAYLQFRMIYEHPFEYTSDDIFFAIHALRKEIPPTELEDNRERFFSKGQPCFRSSPLTKQYGWGIYSNEEGKVALFGAESEAYRNFVGDGSIVKVKAMRTKRQ